ncbi:MAG: glycosyltransferase [Desulfobacteraceae bacterium]|nr:MAG: glycosyltransferase [Desulfobacteraceae bacterium]
MIQDQGHNTRLKKRILAENCKRTGISVVIPVHNEKENLPKLYQDLTAALESTGESYEIIWINDGSNDGSEEMLNAIAKEDRCVKVIHFKRNFGQTAAIMAGIDHSSGDVLVTIDGDNQNDPADIERLIEKLREGYDVVSGWRKDRKDGKVLRIWPSKVANWVISKISGTELHDYGCTLKAYRRDVLNEVKLYGEMHRFIPVYARWQGARVVEMIVNHHERSCGKSHYTLSRTSGVILDLLLIKFMDRYSRNPIHLFGGFGLLNFVMAFLSSALMVYYKFWGGKTFIETPLPIFSIFFLLIGVTSIFIGILAEILMRTYYESQRKKPYSIREIIQ